MTAGLAAVTNDATRAHSASPAPVLGEPLTSLLVDWFAFRDRLCDLRSKADQTDQEAEEVYQRLSELVDIADGIVGELVPDVAARESLTDRIVP
ncbi:hypothetical protein CKJ56_12655 [Mycobacterium intracellulare subsp. chimaera]|nr:hypothetical protein CKJ58_25685 [Mycobacterium intracellulare subsp. chimaera]PBA61221.1 hypothetical protein CKJ56_12655 [Mycobacterium intracellulare subsp. chimaera]